MKSRNEGGGFGYTAVMNAGGDYSNRSEKEARDQDAKAEKMFDQVGQMIKREIKGVSDSVVVEVLDSRQGRHLADAMVTRSGLASSLPAKFRKDYWDWWAKEQGKQFSDPESAVDDLRSRHGVGFFKSAK